MDKEKVKRLVCEAIDNIPDCAEITECWSEHNLYSPTASIHINIMAKDRSKKTLIEFNDAARNSFGTNMDSVE